VLNEGFHVALDDLKSKKYFVVIPAGDFSDFNENKNRLPHDSY
jgi:hypothetical protein